MFCSKCGAQIADNSVFCPKCGAPQGAGAATPAGAPPPAGAIPPPATPYAPQPGSYVPPPPGVFVCPFCRYQGPPIIERKISSNGWVVFALLVVFCLPLCWLPFVLDDCKEDTRKCPSCGARLG